ncbi:VPLPA-CTERM sorting domain-containing protein [Paracoccus shandongensis]|uniref:VPLPA-CTERM sorting domain-containing protein n=1 Tax=Paracoccus shandongensis TaxID=2816048 RepID=UPI001A904B27|nr:VPLPA-CTERM sorting domain-containing protein [Paracoccus shandongensis]
MKTSFLAAALVAGLPFAASAAIIDNGTIQMGVDTLGQLNVGGGKPSAGGVTPTGLRYIPTNYEATAPGCLCEGWGVGIGDPGATAFGYANNAAGISNLTSVSFTNTASTATSVATVDGTGLRVTHTFTPAAETANLYRVSVKIENTGATDIADLRYTRTFDWDVEPTSFNEYVTHVGTGTTSTLLYSNNNGFENSNPFALRSPIGGVAANTDFTDAGAFDHGSNFDFGFGELKAGEAYDFDIFYGAAANETMAIAALSAVQVELYSLGQSMSSAGGPANDDVTFMFAFKGVGGSIVVPPVDPAPVPVPAAGFLLLGGLGAMGALRLRRKNG